MADHVEVDDIVEEGFVVFIYRSNTISGLRGTIVGSGYRNGELVGLAYRSVQFS